jgi:alginate O-acetyltransferase complex protein AlgI
MLFNSLEFFLLVIVTFILYYNSSARKLQAPLLIISSFVFYAYNKPVLLILLISSILLFSLFSHAVSYGPAQRRYLLVSAGVITALSILGAFKYGPLIVETILPEGHGSKEGIGYLLMTLPLPIGISFFTFEGISLIVDTYRSKEKKEGSSPLEIASAYGTHLRNTALFISFFPHLIAGPIIKAHQFFPQIKVKFIKDIDWDFAFKTIILGYFFKMVIADNLKDHTLLIFPYMQLQSTMTLIMMLYGFSMQIFADFAGYSLIAIGVSSLFGYKLPINFNFPYIAASFADFWKRWHISLSTWLKSYLYIPLGGNRKGINRVYLNILIVMFLGGLWHGAKWSFALWGVWHGVLLVVERLLVRVGFKTENRVLNGVKILVVFTAVSFSWLLFKLQDFEHVILFFNSLLGNLHLKHNVLSIGCILIYSMPIVIYHAFYFLQKSRRLEGLYYKYESLVYGALLFLTIINRGSSSEFIYFQF